MKLDPSWLEALRLEEDEVLLVMVHAEASGTLYERCKAVLSGEELERLRRLRAGVPADEFVVGRGCLRILLGAILRRRPEEVVLQTGEHGKPFTAGVEFNVSHSRGLILMALSRSAAVGVDVEAVDVGIEALEIARDTFAAAEVARLERAADGEERVQAFYRCWARKEAVAKAHGQGITLSLKDFAVDADAEDERTVVVGCAETGANRRFFLQGIALPSGFAGALAVDRPGLHVRRHCVEV